MFATKDVHPDDSQGWLACGSLLIFAIQASIRKYMLASVVLFIVFSILCGLSWNLPSMIAFRGLQGLFGGALIPLAYTLIMTLLPEKERPKGMALFSLSAVSAPAFGSALGGWLTDTWSWHMIFFINLVPGTLMFSGRGSGQYGHRLLSMFCRLFIAALLRQCTWLYPQKLGWLLCGWACPSY